MSNTSTVFIVHAADGVKDLAIDVCIASGEDDVFIDMDTVEERLSPDDSQEFKDLKEIIEAAKEKDAEYIHLF